MPLRSDRGMAGRSDDASVLLSRGIRRVARARMHANFRHPGLSPNHAHPHAVDVPVARRAVAPLHAEEVS